MNKGLKSTLILIIPCLLIISFNHGTYGFTWTSNIIATNIDGPVEVYAFDIDADGDLDIITTAYFEDTIYWWENDGTPEDGGWTEHIITSSFDGVRSISLADIDSDGNVDIIGAAIDADKINWWENDGTPGDGGWIEHCIVSNFNGAWDISVADFDSDGDFDIVGMANSVDEISWWENNSTPYNNRWTKHLITSNFSSSCISLHPADFDADGDIDMVGTSDVPNCVNLWDNFGPPTSTFYVGNIIDNPVNTYSVYAADIDLDGDMDPIVADNLANSIYWWENIGSIYSFSWPKYTITTGFGDVRSVQATDMNSDGYPDILGSARGSMEIAWWQNDGTPNDGGWLKQIITSNFNSARFAYGADIDSDGDIDVVGTAYDGDTIVWWSSKLNETDVACSLKWSINPGFKGIDGVNPNIGKSGDTYNFEVVYINSSNKAPTTAQVWVDLNQDQDYNDSGEKIDMNYISGSYNTGALYNRSLTANSAGKYKYRFYFKYNNKYAGDKPAEDHYFYFNQPLALVKNTNTPGGYVLAGSNNISILAFKISDNLHNLVHTIRITNGGTMQNSVDVSNVKLWYDSGSVNYLWDSSDTQFNGTAVWNSVSHTYDFTNLAMPSDANMIVTIDVSSGAIDGRSFQAGIRPGNVFTYNTNCNTDCITNDNIVSVVPFPPVAPIITFSTAVSYRQIDLQWNNVLNETSYTLFRNTDNNSNTASNITGLPADQTNYNDMGLTTYTSYFYWIKAYNISGASGFSTYISNKTLPAPPIANPPVITNIHALSSRKMYLEWTAPLYAEVFHVFRNSENNSNTAGNVLSTLDLNCIDSLLSPETMYYYWVKSSNFSGLSRFSDVASNLTFCSAPVITGIQALSAHEVSFTWNKFNTGIFYKIYRSQENNTEKAQLLNTLSKNQFDYTDLNLIPDTEYFYWVKVLNTSGESEFSQTAGVKTLASFEKNLNNLIIGPSPYKPYDGNIKTGTIASGIIFSRLTADATIEIYTVNGQLIAKLEEKDRDGKLIWKVPNRVSSGLYICRVSNSLGESKVCKILIIK